MGRNLGTYCQSGKIKMKRIQEKNVGRKSSWKKSEESVAICTVQKKAALLINNKIITPRRIKRKYKRKVK